MSASQFRNGTVPIAFLVNNTSNHKRKAPEGGEAKGEHLGGPNKRQREEPAHPWPSPGAELHLRVVVQVPVATAPQNAGQGAAAAAAAQEAAPATNAAPLCIQWGEDQLQRYVCPLCGQWFVNREDHAAHHPPEAQVCSNSSLAAREQGALHCLWPACNTQFTSSGKLRRHVRTHVTHRKFSCEICGVGFFQPGDLARHVRIHTGEKPYACPYDGCGRSFALSTTLYRHKRTHTGEKPHKCTHVGCSRSFIQRHDMLRHLRTHTGEKPFGCPTCGRCFGDISGMRAHEARVHGAQSARNRPTQ